MNILNSNNIQSSAKAGKNLSDANLASEMGLGALGGNAKLDPETIKLLQANSEAQGLNFEQVLKATESGKDPNAVMALMKGQKQATNNQLGEQVSTDLNLEAGLPKANEEKSSLFSRLLNTKGSEAPTKTEVGKANAGTMTAASFALESKVNNAQMQALNSGSIPAANSKLQVQPQVQPQAQAQAQAQEGLNSQPATPKTDTNNLLKLTDFMTNQSPAIRKNAGKSAYKPLSESMFNQKVEGSLQGVIKQPGSETKLQDVMFGNLNNQNQNMADTNSGQAANMMNNQSSQATTSSAATAKVFDINSLQGTSGSEEVIAKVQDYITQVRVGKRSDVQMSFKHDDLGRIDLHVQKVEGDKLNISIATSSVEGKDFFMKNQTEILRNLAQSGVQVGGFKLEISQPQNTANQNLNQDNGKQESAQSGQNQRQSENGQRDDEARKRSELWEAVEQKDVA